MVFSSLVTIIPSADGVQFLPLNTKRELIRHLKVAWPSILIGTYFMFESLTLKKKIDLYCKTILPRLNFTMILFFGRSEYMSRGNDVTTVLALNQISALFGIFFWKAKYATYSLGKCLLLCKVSQTSVEEEFRDILEFLLKGYKLCMHWRLGLMQTNLLLFGCFRKGFITHSFLKH